MATQVLPLLVVGGSGSGLGLDTVGTERGERVGVVAMGLMGALLVVGKGAIVVVVVGDAGRPVLSQELPDPPHFVGKKRRTSLVMVSSNRVANF